MRVVVQAAQGGLPRDTCYRNFWRRDCSAVPVPVSLSITFTRLEWLVLVGLDAGLLMKVKCAGNLLIGLEFALM